MRPVESTDVDQPVFKRQSGEAEAVSHPERSGADIQDYLHRKPVVLLEDAQAISQHADGHLWIVGALQFDMDQIADSRFAQEVNSGIGDLRQFDIAPGTDLQPCQSTQRKAGGIQQNFFQSGVVFVHPAGL